MQPSELPAMQAKPEFVLPSIPTEKDGEAEKILDTAVEIFKASARDLPEEDIHLLKAKAIKLLRNIEEHVDLKSTKQREKINKAFEFLVQGHRLNPGWGLLPEVEKWCAQFSSEQQQDVLLSLMAKHEYNGVAIVFDMLPPQVAWAFLQKAARDKTLNLSGQLKELQKLRDFCKKFPVEQRAEIVQLFLDHGDYSYAAFVRDLPENDAFAFLQKIEKEGHPGFEKLLQALFVAAPRYCKKMPLALFQKAIIEGSKTGDEESMGIILEEIEKEISYDILKPFLSVKLPAGQLDTLCTLLARLDDTLLVSAFEAINKLPEESRERAICLLFQKIAPQFLVLPEPFARSWHLVIAKASRDKGSLGTSTRAALEQQVKQLKGKKVSFKELEPFLLCQISQPEDLVAVMKESKDATLESIATRYDDAISKEHLALPLALQTAYCEEIVQGKTELSYDDCKYLFALSLPQKLFDALMEKLKASKDPKMQNSIKRYLLLAKNWTTMLEKEALDPWETLKIAFFIEHEVEGVAKTGKAVLLRRKETGLKRTLQIQGTGAVSILANRKVSRLQAAGSWKKVVSAATFALDNYQYMTATVRAFSKVRFEQGTKKVDVSAIKEAVDEMANEGSTLLNIYKGEKGFLKLHSMIDYTFVRKGTRIPRISFVMEPCDGDLGDLFFGQDRQRETHRTALKAIPLVDLARGILTSIIALHTADGLAEPTVHGDIKLANILYKFDPRTGEIVTKIGDLGTAKTVGVMGWKSGPQYPHALSSSPDLVAKAQGDTIEIDWLKADSFAVGRALYEMLYKKAVPWIEEVQMLYGFPVTDEKSQMARAEFAKKNQLKEKLHAKVRAVSESSRAKELEAKVAAGGSLNKDELFEHIMYQLLKCDPEQRMSCQDALKTIEENERRTIESAMAAFV